MNTDTGSSNAGQTLSPAHGTALLRRLQNHRAMMSPEQKQRHAGKLLLEATDELQRLIQLCQHVHDRLLRGEDNMTLTAKLAEGWRGPNDRTEAQPIHQTMNTETNNQPLPPATC